MSEKQELLTTNRKALTINLDGTHYGTIAEIGAGQEVARVRGGGPAGVAHGESPFVLCSAGATERVRNRAVRRRRGPYGLRVHGRSDCWTAPRSIISSHFGTRFERSRQSGPEVENGCRRPSGDRQRFSAH